MRWALAGCETTTDVATPPHTPRLSLAYTLSSREAQKFFVANNLFVSISQSILETTNLATPMPPWSCATPVGR